MTNQVVEAGMGTKSLNILYNSAVNGIVGNGSHVSVMAKEYMNKYGRTEDACKAMMRMQIRKCTTSGVLSGIGGIITLPITLPLNLSSVIYMQMRMIACIAYMAGYEVNSDQTQTLVLSCLMGVPISQFLKKTTVNISTKTATKLIGKIPGAVLMKINQMIGFRFITKFGTTGAINLGKSVPILGSIAGGCVDYCGTRTIANTAYNMFFENKYN
jgi:hypothetical protein